MCKHRVNLLRSTSKQQVLILAGNTVRLTAEGYRFEAEAGVAKDRFTLSFGEPTAIEEVETDAEVRATTDGLHIRAAKAVHMSVCFSRVHPRRKDGNSISGGSRGTGEGHQPTSAGSGRQASVHRVGYGRGTGRCDHL